MFNLLGMGTTVNVTLRVGLIHNLARSGIATLIML